MGEKLHNPLNMARAKLTHSQTYWSWRATVRNVRKGEGTAEPQDVFLLAPWPSLQTFYFSATSHRGRARCCRILHPLSPAAAALNIPLPSGTLLGHSHLGRQDWLPWGPWRGVGQMQVSELLTFPWAKPISGTLGLTACVPLELPLCLWNVGSQLTISFQKQKRESESSITSDFESPNYLASTVGEEQHVCPSYTKYSL